MPQPARLGAPGLRRLLITLLAIVWTVPALAARSRALPGAPAPDFALHAVAGPNVRLSEHIGQVVVISFWGSGCDGCRAQLEALEQDFSRYRAQGLRIYGVEVADDATAALRFARAIHVTFPLLLDPRKSVARLYDVDNLPMTVLIDRDGKIRQVVRDFNETSRRACENELRTLLAE
ncbi:MAG TPA: TlpA disulfide reductase family protein [Steroidobacteraceae bacterium]|nr:TlpA disulfide reductase family protein [Steroidobacteraceae bacterium]